MANEGRVHRQLTPNQTLEGRQPKPPIGSCPTCSALLGPCPEPTHVSTRSASFAAHASGSTLQRPAHVQGERLRETETSQKRCDMTWRKQSTPNWRLARPVSAPGLCHVEAPCRTKTCSLECPSTRDAASCCQPRRTLPGLQILRFDRFRTSSFHQRTPRKRSESQVFLYTTVWQRQLLPATECLEPSRFTTNRMTTSRCLEKTIGRHSAQLAHHADLLGRTAPRNPRPPKTNDAPTALRMCQHATEAPPHAVVVGSRLIDNKLWFDNSQEISSLSPKRNEPATAMLVANPVPQESPSEASRCSVHLLLQTGFDKKMDDRTGGSP